MLDEVQQLAADGGVVEGGDVPDPDRADEDEDGDRRVEQDLQQAAVEQGDDVLPPHARAGGPQGEGRGGAEQQQRRDHHEDEHVLDHVHPEEVVGVGVDRRDEGQQHQHDAAREGGRPPAGEVEAARAGHCGIGGDGGAQPSVAPRVGGGEEQGQHDAQGVEAPDGECLEDLPRLRRRAVMRGGDGRRQHGGQPRERGGGEQSGPARGHGRPDSSATRWRAPRVARERQARKRRLKTRIHTAPTKCQYIVAASTAVLRWASKWPSWDRIQRKAMNSRPPRTCAPWKPVSR